MKISEKRNIHFILEPKVLIFFLIKYSRVPLYYNDKNITDIQNRLFDFDKKYYNEITEYPIDNLIKEKIPIIFTQKFEQYCEAIYGMEQYKNLSDKIICDFKPIIKLFNKKLNFVETNLDLYFNLKMNKQVNIYMLPLNLQISNSYENNIFYGKISRTPFIIEIWHEILHCYFSNSNLEHCVIELITNYFLYKLLFPKDFNNFVLYDGHWYLSDLKFEIKDKFDLFLENYKKNNNIYDFIKNSELQLKNYFFDTVSPLGKSDTDNINDINAESHINLSPFCFILQGTAKSILLDGKSKSIYHIDKKLSDFLYNACYYDRIDFNLLNDRNINLNLKSLLGKKIIKISNYKEKNIRIENFRNKNLIIRSINFEIINICNQHCFHCYFFQNKNNKNKKRVFDFGIYKKIINDLIKYGLSVIDLVGGEPTLAGRRKLEKFIKFAYDKKNINVICLTTNCLLLSDKMIEMLSGYKNKLVVAITIHSADEELNDKISGYKGDLKNKLEVIEKLKGKNIRFNVSTVFSRYNIEDFDNTVKLLNSVKLHYQTLRVAHFARITDPKIKLHKDNGIFKKLNFLYPFENLKKMDLNMYDVLIKLKNQSCFFDKLYINNGYKLYLCNEGYSEDTYIGDYKKSHYRIYNILDSELYKQRVLKNSSTKCNICEFNALCMHCFNFQKYHEYYHMDEICSYDPGSGEIKEYPF